LVVRTGVPAGDRECVFREGSEGVKTKLPFEDWKERVDATIVRLVGLGSDDLPDCNYWDMWERGVSPVAAALVAIANARREMGL
jgi:hypothetical protein